MSEPLPTSYLTKLIFGDGESPDLTDLDEQQNPMEGFVLRAQVQSAVKSAGASIVLDLSLPADDDVDSDDAPFYKMPRIVHGVSDALTKTSDAAFVRVLAKVRSVFDGHPEEYEQAVECVTRIRDEARTRAIATAREAR